MATYTTSSQFKFDDLQKSLQSSSKFIRNFLIALTLFLLIAGSIRVNSPTQVSIVTTLGRISSTQGSGLYLKFPLISKDYIYDTSIQSIECITGKGKNNCQTLDASTKDLQDVKTAVQVSYQVDGNKANDLFKLVQDQQTFNDIIVPSTVAESLKVVTAKYTGEELVLKRGEVKNAIEKELQDRLNQYFLIIKSINIVNFEFSASFQKEIDLKVATQQQTLQKEEELKRVQAESKIITTKAQAESDATNIQGQSLKNNPEILELKKIEKWDGKLPQVQGGGSPIINLK
ncbi:MAG: prohibitin family protein [candidate division SR1 bacterium]|nr:prohibitin family protein [candidate division SR1 bacterium]